MVAVEAPGAQSEAVISAILYVTDTPVAPEALGLCGKRTRTVAFVPSNPELLILENVNVVALSSLTRLIVSLPNGVETTGVKIGSSPGATRGLTSANRITLLVVVVFVLVLSLMVTGTNALIWLSRSVTTAFDVHPEIELVLASFCNSTSTCTAPRVPSLRTTINEVTPSDSIA